MNSAGLEHRISGECRAQRVELLLVRDDVVAYGSPGHSAEAAFRVSSGRIASSLPIEPCERRVKDWIQRRALQVQEL